jgi:hypothetical protein
MAPAMQQHLQDKKDKKGKIAGHAVNGRQTVTSQILCGAIASTQACCKAISARQGKVLLL